MEGVASSGTTAGASGGADVMPAREGVPPSSTSLTVVDLEQLVRQLRSTDPDSRSVPLRAAEAIESLQRENDRLRRELEAVLKAVPRVAEQKLRDEQKISTEAKAGGAGSAVSCQASGALREATIAGDPAQVQKHLEAGIDPNDPSELLASWSPLHYAAQLGHVAIINLLLDYHAKPVLDRFGETPLMQAGYWGHNAAVGVLTERGAGIKGEAPASMIVDAESEKKIGSWRAEGHVTIICSAPEFSGPLMGKYPDGSQDEVMVALFSLCDMNHKHVKFGYDWAGSATAEPADINEERVVPDCCLSLGCACGALKSSVKIKGAVQWGDPKSVAGSLWFPKYITKVQSNIMAAAQLGLRFIEMIAIRGGPVTQLEHRTMPFIIAGAIKDLRAKGVSISLLGDAEITEIKVFLRVMDYGDFIGRFYETAHDVSVGGICKLACANKPSHMLAWLEDSALGALGLSPADVAAAARSRICFTQCDSKVVLSESGTVATGQGSAVCADEMIGGAHYIEFTILRQQDSSAYLGVVGVDFVTKGRRPEQAGFKLLAIPSKFDDTHASEHGWVFDTHSSMHRHGQYEREWPGSPKFKQLKEGDTVGLLLNVDAGSMAVYLNGTRCGMMIESGLPRPLRWAAELVYGSSVRIERKAIPLVTAEMQACDKRMLQEHNEKLLRHEFFCSDIAVSEEGIAALAAAGLATTDHSWPKHLRGTDVARWHQMSEEEAMAIGLSTDDFAAMHANDHLGKYDDDDGIALLLGTAGTSIAGNPTGSGASVASGGDELARALALSMEQQRAEPTPIAAEAQYGAAAAELMSWGFDKASVLQALDASGGDQQGAANILLG